MSTLFSKIAAGEIPSYKCAENEKFYAFLDINPIAIGHTLVIPRKETDYIFDMDDWELAEFEVFAKKVAEIVLGLEVPHAHIQLIPLNKESDINMSKKLKLSESQFKEISNKIYTEFKKQNPNSYDR